MKSDALIAAERECAVADARLDIIESMRWAIAGLLSCCVYLIFNSWLAAALIYLIPVFLLPYQFVKESDAADDKLNRLMGTGKYSIASQKSDLMD